jgi:hypothetical protein
MTSPIPSSTPGPTTVTRLPDDVPFDQTASSSNARAAAPPPPPPPPDAPSTDDQRFVRALQARQQQGRPAHNHAAVEGLQVRAEPPEAKFQRGIEQFREDACPTYRTPEGEVRVPAAFRMYPGYSPQQAASVEKHRPALVALGARVGLGEGAVENVRWGRGTPEQVRTLTQGLIDDGQLKPTGGTLEQRVRQMQFDYGIGFDCAGYSQQALLAGLGLKRADLGLKPIRRENLDCDDRKYFEPVGRGDARAGDVLKLGAPAGESVGHRVIIANTGVLTDSERQRLQTVAEARPGGDEKEVLGWQHVRVYEVDSSWGASGNPNAGGVRRETLYVNEDTKKWAWVGPSGLLEQGDRPFDHPLDGIFRVKGGN